jgi:hypothetical protein
LSSSRQPKQLDVTWRIRRGTMAVHNVLADHRSTGPNPAEVCHAPPFPRARSTRAAIEWHSPLRGSLARCRVAASALTRTRGAHPGPKQVKRQPCRPPIDLINTPEVGSFFGSLVHTFAKVSGYRLSVGSRGVLPECQ